MTIIKDIIDAERRRLRTHARKGTQHHSWGEAALDRIEAAVDKMENALVRYEADDVRYLQRIAELEAQIPKVVVPSEVDHIEFDEVVTDWLCTCGEIVCKSYVACSRCGAKLDWSET